MTPAELRAALKPFADAYLSALDSCPSMEGWEQEEPFLFRVPRLAAWRAAVRAVYAVRPGEQAMSQTNRPCIPEDREMTAQEKQQLAGYIDGLEQKCRELTDTNAAQADRQKRAREALIATGRFRPDEVGGDISGCIKTLAGPTDDGRLAAKADNAARAADGGKAARQQAAQASGAEVAEMGNLRRQNEALRTRVRDLEEQAARGDHHDRDKEPWTDRLPDDWRAGLAGVAEGNVWAFRAEMTGPDGGDCKACVYFVSPDLDTAVRNAVGQEPYAGQSQPLGVTGEPRPAEPEAAAETPPASGEEQPPAAEESTDQPADEQRRGRRGRRS